MNPRRMRKDELVAEFEILLLRLARAEESLRIEKRDDAQFTCEAGSVISDAPPPAYSAEGSDLPGAEEPGEALFKTLIESAPDFIFQLDGRGRIVYANKVAAGYDRESFIGLSLFDWTAAEHRHIPRAALAAVLAAGVIQEYEVKGAGPCGGQRWYRERLSPIVVDDRVTGVVLVATDITRYKRVEETLRFREQELLTLSDHSPDHIARYDRDLRILYANVRIEGVAGCSRDALLGKSVCELGLPRDIAAPLTDALRAAFASGSEQVLEFDFPVAGAIRHFHNRIVPEFGADGAVASVLAIARDLTERKRREEEITYQAYHDPLTGLPNRMLFMDHLKLAIVQAHRDRTRLSVMFLDLDHFKMINDTLGHDAGDKLLKEVAARLKPCIRESDTISRRGGDEFTILLHQISQVEDAAKIAKKILTAFQSPFVVEDQELQVTPSIGISVYPDDGDDVETLLKNADIAMYHAKEQGRNNHQFYDPVMNIATLERMILENSLRLTLKRGELQVYYLPQVRTDTLQIICMEALVRWRHPELGLIDPLLFIPLAEETGFISTMDEWVLRTACRERKSWDEAGYPPLGITVNLSARQFQRPNLVETVAQIVREEALAPDRLTLEIAEEAAMKDVETATATMQRLADLGVRLSLDDVGTSAVSLEALTKMPLQKIKIDKRFIKGLADDAGARTITGAVISLARCLGLKAVAEGVETEEQLAFLRGKGCDELQGYLFSEALKAEEVPVLMKRWGAYVP